MGLGEGKLRFQTMGRSSPLVMEDNDLEEGKPGGQTHHMGQHGQRHGVRLNEITNYMPCHLVITRLASACGGTDALGLSEDLGGRTAGSGSHAKSGLPPSMWVQ